MSRHRKKLHERDGRRHQPRWRQRVKAMYMEPDWFKKYGVIGFYNTIWKDKLPSQRR